MQPTTSSLINATRKAIKFLQRDFLELEMLQRSSRGNIDFCNKSYERAKSLLQEELQKHSKFLFFPEDKPEWASLPDIVLFINPLDSVNNLARSIPFFAISITYLKKINETLLPTCTVINFPALDEIYYAEKGGGAWVEKNTLNNTSNSKGVRLRVSGIDNIKNALIATDNDDLAEKKNIRVFGSHCYEMTLLAAGKLDIVSFSSLNYTLKPGFELVATEAGGSVVIRDKKFIATNYELKDNLNLRLCL